MPNALTPGENEVFDRSFKKAFVISQDEVELVEIFQKNKDKIKAFAEIMKGELNSPFGGANPASDEFGMMITPPEAFGYTDWHSLSVTANTGGGTTADAFIDSGTADEMSGSTGIDNPMKVGEPAGHILLGYESLHPSPKAYKLKMKKSEKPLPIWFMYRQLKASQRNLYQANMPVHIPPVTKFAASLVGGYNGGDDIPEIVGVTFVDGEYFTEEDPNNWQGTSTSSPVVQL